MVDDIVNSIVHLYKQNDWKTIIGLYGEHPERNKLLWVFPTEENFEFIKKCLVDLKCAKVLSIGCGSGLLEWMITEATGFPVSGLEIDGAWWQCKYAPPTFIPLTFTSSELDKDIITLLEDSNDTVLLFCYFNNGPAFRQYLEKYSGRVIIIIGPGCGKGVHSDPAPFENISEEWIMHEWQEVGKSKDFIAVYNRRPIKKKS